MFKIKTSDISKVGDKSVMESIRENCEGLEGFDIQAGLTWIYPTNYPLREYQYNIVEQALYKNTLVTLPTGLGKTFIAAVVMYNYYRWYPTGKIVFMAPTRPLVKQQMNACYDIMAIPKDVTVELTGTNKNTIRNEIWSDKRVFFITPQILQNDLDVCPELASLIKCIVFDEAHKSRGNYAYCEIMKKMKAQAKYFRVLALSATPGNSINDVGEVINTLMISHLEYKTEVSEDVKPYVFQRKLETIVVPLGEKLLQVRNDYLEVLEKYSRTLVKYKVVQGNCSTLTKGAIFRIKKEYQERSQRDPHFKEVMLTLNICMSLFHANELLIRHGLRGFLSYFEEHINDPILRNNDSIIRIMEDLRSYLGPMPAVEKLPDGSYPEVPTNTIFGHPKFYKLRDILISHFNNSEDDSKVIVFFEYRDSVKEAFLILLQARPIIRPEMFMGQRSGVTQKMQLKVINTFRDGDCNTLLSTSIGEEGLDVGEVDLIICFDISNKSPIRMVQRMGRTGRKREGQVIILVTEGREQRTLDDCLFHKNNMKSWAGSTEIMSKFFVASPRMVPMEIIPQCMKMHITVAKQTVQKNSSLKNFIKNMSSGSSSTVSEDVEIVEIEERIPNQISLFNEPISKDFDLKPFYNNYIENQRMFQHSSKISSSDASKLFVSLMKFADSKRFNIPLTQGASVSTKNLKQGDIRNMFNNGAKYCITPSQDVLISQAYSLPPTQKKLSTQEIEDKKFRTKLHEEISIYHSITDNTPEICKFCERGIKCAKYRRKIDSKFLENLKHWIPPVIQNISIQDLETYKKYKLQDKNYVEVTKKEGDIESKDNKDIDDSILELLESDLSDLFPDEKIDEKILKEKFFNFDDPKSFGNLVDKCMPTALPSENQKIAVEKENVQKTDNSSIINILTPDKNDQAQTSDKSCNDENLDSVLSFFKLDKIEDIFDLDFEEDKADDTGKTIIDVNVTQDTEFDREIEFERESSPVLSTQVTRKRKINTKQKPTSLEKPGSPVLDSSNVWRSQKDVSFNGRPCLDIIDTSIDEKVVLTLPKKFSQKRKAPILEKNSVESKSEEVDFIREKSIKSDEENLLGFFSTKRKTKSLKASKLDHIHLGIEDIFDLGSFGLTIDDFRNSDYKLKQIQSEEKENVKKSTNYQEEYHHDFSMLVSAESTRIETDITKEIPDNNNDGGKSEKKSKAEQISTCYAERQSKNQENERSVLEIEDFCDLSIFGLTIDDEKMNMEQQKLPIDDFTKNTCNDHILRNRCLEVSKDLESCELSGYQQITKQTEKSDMFHGQERNRNQAPTENPVESDRNGGDNVSDIIIIEDSPTKDSFVDLTQSPKVKNKIPPKRKVLSQMSITQILSLAEKSTQSALCSNNTVSSVVDKTKISKLPIVAKSQHNSEQNHVLSDIEMTSPSYQYEKVYNTSLLDDLRNFGEFNESSIFKPPSPVFKKPNIGNLDKLRKERKKASSSIQSESSSNLNNTIDSKEDDHCPSGNSKLSCSLLNSNSDDEFETTIYPSTIRNRKQCLRKKLNDSSSSIPKKKVRKKRTCNFIEEEADVSIDRCSVSDDETDEDGSLDESFVDDDAQNFQNNTQMHADYLRSIRSPTTGHKFKFPRTLRPITDDIFSQPADRDVLNTYEIDSFCVNTEEVIEESHDLSELEILERQLEKRKKKRKVSDDESIRIKRRRIRMMDSDSD